MMSKAERAAEPTADGVDEIVADGGDEVVRRSGTVALVGRTNVGKSTLLNAALELPLAIVSHRPQTTRDQLLGVVRHGGAEIGLLDTPGLHRPHTQLGREMNRSARAATREADVVVFVTALPRRPRRGLEPHAEDVRLLRQISGELPVVLVINKIDLLKDKAQLLPLMAKLADVRELAAVVPISALRDDGVRRVLDEVAKLLPQSDAWRFGEDDITNRPMRYFAAEYVREPILRTTSQEVPHAVAVTIDRMIEDDLVSIDATIHVERRGQKAIIIGDKGAVLKRIGSTARKRIEQLIGRQVNLKLWVRVTKDWRQRPAALADFGLLFGSPQQQVRGTSE